MTLIEIIIVSVIMALIGAMLYPCISQCFEIFKNSRTDYDLIASQKLARGKIRADLENSAVSTITVIQSLYNMNGVFYECDAISFRSLMKRDGTITWDPDGNPQWQRECVFYLSQPEGVLYFQENALTPTIEWKRAPDTFTPGKNDRAIARNILEMSVTDQTGNSCVKDPIGDYIRIRMRFGKQGKSLDSEFVVDARKTENI